MTRWLNAREWMEYERLTGLPHADFAADALAQLDAGQAADELYETLLDDINRATGDVVDGPEAIVDAYRFRDAVLSALNDAGVADGDLTPDQAVGLLRMFLPS